MGHGSRAYLHPADLRYVVRTCYAPALDSRRVIETVRTRDGRVCLTQREFGKGVARRVLSCRAWDP